MKTYPVCENRTFLRAYRKGKKYAGRYIVIYALNTGPEMKTRLGLTVTKGRGGAVVRNRIKRVIRAAWRDVLLRRGVMGSRDVIIVARDAAITAKSNDIIPELERGLDTLGVLPAKEH